MQALSLTFKQSLKGLANLLSFLDFKKCFHRFSKFILVVVSVVGVNTIFEVISNLVMHPF